MARVGAARSVLILAAGDRQGGGMDATAGAKRRGASDDFAPVEQIAGALDGGVLRRSATTPRTRCRPIRRPRPAARGARAPHRLRHRRRLAGAPAGRRLGAPAVLSTFSRLLIDPNRGGDDPTLVMRYSDGAIVPGNARIDAAEIERRRAPLSGRPTATAIAATVEAMMASGEPPAILSIHSFTPHWRGRRGRGRSACCGIPIRACPRRCCRRSRAEPDLGAARNRRQRALRRRAARATRSTRSPPRAASPTR